jgi:hypothetical protein
MTENQFKDKHNYKLVDRCIHCLHSEYDIIGNKHYYYCVHPDSGGNMKITEDGICDLYEK